VALALCPTSTRAARLLAVLAKKDRFRQQCARLGLSNYGAARLLTARWRKMCVGAVRGWKNDLDLTRCPADSALELLDCLIAANSPRVRVRETGT